LDVDGIAKLIGGGAVGTYGLRLIYSWFNREKQESSLYRNEVSAHDQTKKELAEERILRKAAEMELREARDAHDKDRDAWFDERDKDRELREQLKDEIFQLRTEVKQLRATMQSKGFETNGT
jgi:hypothetical protein